MKIASIEIRVKIGTRNCPFNTPCFALLARVRAMGCKDPTGRLRSAMMKASPLEALNEKIPQRILKDRNEFRKFLNMPEEDYKVRYAI